MVVSEIANWPVWQAGMTLVYFRVGVSVRSYFRVRVTVSGGRRGWGAGLSFVLVTWMKMEHGTNMYYV